MKDNQFTVSEVAGITRGRSGAKRSIPQFLVWDGWDDCPVHTHQDRAAAERCADLFQVARIQAEEWKQRERNAGMLWLHSKRMEHDG